MKFLFIIFLLILIPVETWCQDQVERAVITYKNTKGFFFSEDIGTRMLSDLENVNFFKEQIGALEKKLELKDEYLKLLKLEIKIVDEINAKMRKNVDIVNNLRVKEVERCQDKLESSEAWYRSPALWLGVGMVLGGGMAVGMAFGLQEAR